MDFQECVHVITKFFTRRGQDEAAIRKLAVVHYLLYLVIVPAIGGWLIRSGMATVSWGEKAARIMLKKSKVRSRSVSTEHTVLMPHQLH